MTMSADKNRVDNPANYVAGGDLVPKLSCRRIKVWGTRAKNGGQNYCHYHRWAQINFQINQKNNGGEK